MLKKITDFFSQTLDNQQQNEEHRLHLATAALLVEMMQLDDELKPSEQATIIQALQNKFALPADEVNTLVELAHQELKDSTDYHQFTSLIHQHFTYEQKIRLLEFLWQVALSDMHLDKHEAHYMRKISDLLYMQQKDFINSKMRIMQQLGISSP
ncbi:MAG: TerB family tellurite resistance protein [Gammaproteobacteria bacterium]|nr:TerB family tellurite resistance protein [Gammaproteobacteria bacterium]MDH5728052.1 TerB family tellurite resistance protein [Gammaproteobacteria bacterium]